MIFFKQFFYEHLSLGVTLFFNLFILYLIIFIKRKNIIIFIILNIFLLYFEKCSAFLIKIK